VAVSMVLEAHPEKHVIDLRPAGSSAHLILAGGHHLERIDAVRF